MAIEASLQVERASHSLTQLDIMLPSQHFGPHPKHAPEERLMIAVLQDALECVTKFRFATDRLGRKIFREAEEWFCADEMLWPYSFESICGILDLDANAVRQRLQVVPGSPTTDTGRQMAEIERLLDVAGDYSAQRNALARLR